MTLRSIFNAIKGYNNKQEGEWVRARMIAFFASPPEIIRKAKTPEGLFTLGNEQAGGKTKKTLEEIKGAFAAIDKAVSAKKIDNG